MWPLLPDTIRSHSAAYCFRQRNAQTKSNNHMNNTGEQVADDNRKKDYTSAGSATHIENALQRDLKRFAAAGGDVDLALVEVHVELVVVVLDRVD